MCWLAGMHSWQFVKIDLPASPSSAHAIHKYGTPDLRNYLELGTHLWSLGEFVFPVLATANNTCRGAFYGGERLA